DSEELRERGEAAMAEEIAVVSDGMRRHVERELARARAGTRAGGTRLLPARPDVERVVDVLRPTPRGHVLNWEIDVDADLKALVDAQDLAEILGNLGENAVKWAASRVRITGRQENGVVRLAVEDDGPGVPEHLFATALSR